MTLSKLERSCIVTPLLTPAAAEAPACKPPTANHDGHCATLTTTIIGYVNVSFLQMLNIQIVLIAWVAR